MNGEQVDESDSDPSLVLKIGPCNEFTSAGEYHIEFTAEDRWGGRTSRSFELKIADPSSAEASASPPPKLAGPVNAAMPLNADVVVLDHDMSMGQPGQPLALPRRIVTRGHVLTIAADSVTAPSSEILAFDAGEPPQAMNGHEGKPGQNGVAEGEAGKVGEAGGNGVDATGGNDAGPVTITAKSLHGHLTIRNGGSPGARCPGRGWRRRGKRCTRITVPIGVPRLPLRSRPRRHRRSRRPRRRLGIGGARGARR